MPFLLDGIGYLRCLAATPAGSGGDFFLILTRGLRPLAMLWHPYGMLKNGMLRIPDV